MTLTELTRAIRFQGLPRRLRGGPVEAPTSIVWADTPQVRIVTSDKGYPTTREFILMAQAARTRSAAAGAE